MKTQNTDTQEIKDQNQNTATQEQNTETNTNADNMSEQTQQSADTMAEQKPAEEQIDWKDQYIRLQAEFDNFRKRTLREKMELVQSGGSDVLKAILPILDDMQRATAASEKSDDIVIDLNSELLKSYIENGLNLNCLSNGKTLIPYGVA